jgi:hypothetical protein
MLSAAVGRPISGFGQRQALPPMLEGPTANHMRTLLSIAEFGVWPRRPSGGVSRGKRTGGATLVAAMGDRGLEPLTFSV